MKRSILSCAALASAALVVSCIAPAAAGAVSGKAGVPNASAATHPTTSSKAGPAPAALNGYQIVTSSALSSTAGQQTAGGAICPKGTKVVGGGAVISGSSLDENLNGSLPIDTRTWRVFVNNASAVTGTFVVYAVCVAKVQGYVQVVGTGLLNSAGSQVAATATCPDGTVPLGGGGVGSSTSTQANLNSSFALTDGWRADVNNNSVSDETATAIVVCGEAPKKYTQVIVNNGTTVKPGAQNSSVAKCPRGTVVFGGGSFSNSGSVLVNLNSSFPDTTGTWKSYQNNSNTTKNTVSASAVCGKAIAAA